MSNYIIINSTKLYEKFEKMKSLIVCFSNCICRYEYRKIWYDENILPMGSERQNVPQDVMTSHDDNTTPFYGHGLCFVVLCCCFTSTVNIYGHVGTVS